MRSVSFKNCFLAAIRPSSPYFPRMLLTVDIKVYLLDLQSIWSLCVVFFGWHLAFRINNLSHLSSFLRGLPEFWRSSRVLCHWNLVNILLTPYLEMLRAMAIFPWYQSSWNFMITSLFMSIDIGSIFMIIKYWILNLNKVNYLVITRKWGVIKVAVFLIKVAVNFNYKWQYYWR